MQIKVIVGMYVILQVYPAYAEQVNFVQRLGAVVPIAKYDEQIETSSQIATPSDAAKLSVMRTRHARRDAYYDSHRPGPLKDPGPANVTGIYVPFSHWDAKLAAIPAEQSSVVVIGRIVDAQAHVSRSRVSVYSEFTMVIDSVLKNATGSVIAPGSTITADRPVAGVEFPSGTVAYYGQMGMGAPEVGKTYVLFVTSEDSSQDFKIVTGFELTEGKVYAMDGMRAVPAAGRHVSRFDQYNGTVQAEFLELVRTKIDSTSK
jgi:hypothetical protein